ncbi:uncharacterized protein LOC127796081 [Diospyros lotus]|uniref:uncharacterized protein LOC127796081 n=1 Tax=Diospyros lotus TaxID=55363 RepID=UPI00225A3FDB|nr:uncharacterized protein LOC127796081 [Diospyros lotus]
MEEACPSPSSSAVSEALIQTLITRGWCFGDIEQVKGVIMIQSALIGDSCTADLVESELANMDLRSFGGKSLPASSVLRNSSHLAGPKVLQISSARDISRSSIAEISENSHTRRLLRLILTDGHSEVTAIEYSHIPSIANDVITGTKVRIGKRAAVHSGVLCLNPEVITVIGGVVEPLYEEWKMNQKYSGLSLSSLRISKESNTDGPPPFEKLQIRELSRARPPGKFSYYAGSSSKNSRPTVLGKDGSLEPSLIGRHDSFDSKTDGMDNNGKSAFGDERTKEKPSGSEARPKEVVEYVPLQNQAASQKLLLKMSQPNQEDRHFRVRKHRGKGKQEDTPVLTLEEWERRKAGAHPLKSDGFPNVSQDEDLAQQLQYQFHLEDLHIQRVPHESEAENIKLSMFNFQRDVDKDLDGGGFRGRGRGRGRGKGRGRGRGGQV